MGRHSGCHGFGTPTPCPEGRRRATVGIEHNPVMPGPQIVPASGRRDVPDGHRRGHVMATAQGCVNRLRLRSGGRIG